MKKEVITKRVYDGVARGDGCRVLIERGWPPGVAKVDLKHHVWEKNIAPSIELCSWFNNQPIRWTEFQALYFLELRGKRELISKILTTRFKTVTLLYTAKDLRFNHATALQSFIQKDHIRRMK